MSERRAKIDWTKAWGKRYPVLLSYQKTVDIPEYARAIRRELDSLKARYGYSDLDAMLVFKDILYRVWKNAI